MIEDYFCEASKHVNICIDCAKAIGNCPWSEVDVDTGRVKFEEVPGWTVIRVSRRRYVGNRKWDYVEGHQIVACPLFEKDRR